MQHWWEENTYFKNLKKIVIIPNVQLVVYITEFYTIYTINKNILFRTFEYCFQPPRDDISSEP